jgi:hypothetical protein
LFATSHDFTKVWDLSGLLGEKFQGVGIWKGVVLAVCFGISQAFIGLNVQVGVFFPLEMKCLRCVYFTNQI